ELQFSLICVLPENGEVTWQNGLVGEIAKLPVMFNSGSALRTSQTSLVVRPVSMPPPTRAPDVKRASIEKVKKLEICVCLPKSFACVTRLFDCPNFAGEMS